MGANQSIKDIFSEEWEFIKNSLVRSVEINLEDENEFLISLLRLDNSNIRNKAALVLKDRKEIKALEPLLTAIFKKENHNYNGTMVYALESLDCSKKLKEIFEILFYESYEAKISAYEILCNQTFEFTKQDIIEIQQMWEDCKLHPEKYPLNKSLEVMSMIQDAVDGFISYLKTPQDYV